MLVFYFLSIGVGTEISLYYLFFSLPLVLLVSMLPISIAGWGIREVTFVFSFYGIGKHQLVLISLLIGFVNIFWSFFGLFLLLSRKKFF
jgi:glycosyltransferase 2 family protein